MFATVTPLSPHTGRTRPAAPGTHRGHRFSAAQTLDEAYEMRLLGEVARWDDRSAFGEIYEHHRAAVIRAAQQVCRDADTAEDIAQQTFTALWIRAERLAAKSVRLRPWLTTVARNAAIDRLRAEPLAASPAIADVPSSTPSPEDVAIADEFKAELASALGTLSAEQRAAIELVYFADMTYQSAADALGEPIGTIKSRVHLAIGHLRGRLEKSRA